MSSVLTPRACSTPNSASPKSSPTGPTTDVSAKKDDASEKCTAEPPSIRSRLPACVSTASNAMEPTTVTVAMGAAGYRPPGDEPGTQRNIVNGQLHDNLCRPRPFRGHPLRPPGRRLRKPESHPGTGDPSAPSGPRRHRPGA